MSAFVTLEELLTDPEPLDIATGKRVTKKGKEVDAVLRVYPRRPTDVEKQMCLAAANAARRELRVKLNDRDSDEFKLLLWEPLHDADPSLLRMLWVQGQLLERASTMKMDSLEDREVVPEPEGDLISAKEQDGYETAVEAAEDDRVSNLAKALEAVRIELEAEAEAVPDDALFEAAVPAHIETICATTWNETYTDNLIARCTFYDPEYRKPFKTLAQVARLRSQLPAVWRQLTDTHYSLLLELEPGLGN